MQASGIPVKFTLPWAVNAGTTYINTIPTASQISTNPGFASLNDGFPPLNSTPVAAGGIPPRIQDWNGILQQITKWQQWNQAGGAIEYDPTFQAAVGGYPSGAIIASTTTAGLYWRSTVDNNTTNPDTGGAGWVSAFGGRLLNVQIFTASGAYTPTAGTNSIEVEVQGGGGAAGGSPATNSAQASAAGSGGSGAWAWKQITSGFAGVAVTVGAGGIGASGATGGNGSASSFGVLVAANGGNGGSPAGPTGLSANFYGVGGSGGAAGSSGMLNSAGTNGPVSTVLAGQGIPVVGAPGRYLAGYGAGAGGNSNPPSTSAITGASGHSGVVIIREYA